MNDAAPIDSHVHVWPSQSMVAPERFTAEDFLSAAGAAAVRRAVLVQPGLLGYDNRYILAAVRAHPGVFGAVALIDFEADSWLDEMDRLIAAGVRGFRLLARGNARSWLDSRPMQRAWIRAAELQVTMDLLVGPGDLAAVREMCTQFPATRVTIDHLARIGMEGEIRDADIESLCSLSAFPHVYVKLSAFYTLGQRRPPYRDLDAVAAHVLAAFGPGRVMWGSDAPFQLLHEHRYQDSLDFLYRHAEALQAPDADRLLWRTAETLFFSSQK